MSSICFGSKSLYTTDIDKKLNLCFVFQVFFFTDPDVAPPYDDDPEANPDLFKTGWPEGFAAGKAKALHESKAAKAKSGKDGVRGLR